MKITANLTHFHGDKKKKNHYRGRKTQNTFHLWFVNFLKTDLQETIHKIFLFL